MSEINCRGRHKKERVASEYVITPLFYGVLLNGMSMECCCGDAVTTSYFQASLRHKTNNHPGEIVILGDSCGDELFEIAKCGKPPLFNPLANVRKFRGGATATAKNENDDSSGDYATLNWEIYTAMGLVVWSWNGVEFSGIFARLAKWIHTKPSVPVRPDFLIDFVSVVVEHDRQHRTLREIVNDLRIANPSLKDFSFPAMCNVLGRYCMSCFVE